MKSAIQGQSARFALTSSVNGDGVPIPEVVSPKSGRAYIAQHCAFEGCDTVAVARSLCQKHVTQERRAGRIHLYPRMLRQMVPRLCEVIGCGKTHAARGMCITHYRAWQREHQVCALPGCEKPANRRLCGMHAHRERMGHSPAGDEMRSAPFRSLERDSAGRKCCSTCKRWLPLASFGLNRSAADWPKGSMQ